MEEWRGREHLAAISGMWNINDFHRATFWLSLVVELYRYGRALRSKRCLRVYEESWILQVEQLVPIRLSIGHVGSFSGDGTDRRIDHTVYDRSHVDDSNDTGAWQEVDVDFSSFRAPNETSGRCTLFRYF